MDFARKILKSYGWKDGDGLGKNKNGIVKPLKATLKFDNAGFGADQAMDDFNNHWWERVFNEAATNVNITQEDNQIKMNLKDENNGVEISTKGYSTKKLKKLKRNSGEDSSKRGSYENFLKAATLNNIGGEVDNPNKIDTNSIDVSKVNVLTDEELFKACGGRTAHKGARHGLKLSGKLSRIEKQEAELLAKMLAKRGECSDAEQSKNKFEKSSKSKTHLKQCVEEACETLCVEDKLGKKKRKCCKIVGSEIDTTNGEEAVTSSKRKFSKKEIKMENIDVQTSNTDHSSKKSDDKINFKKVDDKYSDNIGEEILNKKKKNKKYGKNTKSGIEVLELRENINRVMTEISEIDTSGGAELDIEDVIQNAKIRRLNDLTDKLWDILKQCSSYKDLKMAYNILFQCAARCNIVNTPTNKNRLAEIITEVANRRLAIPCLSGSEPLELLLEIGMEKLYKDYEYIFVESKVCSANDLKRKSTAHDNKENDAVLPNVRKSLRNAVMQDNAAMRKTLLHNDIKSSGEKIENEIICFKNSNFDENESARTLAKLFQIHCTLEHLLMIRIHLNLSRIYYEVFEQLLRKTPQMADLTCDSLTDEMEIQLSSDYIRELLEGKDPHSRRISMKSNNKLRQVTSTFYFNMENICPPNIAECFNAEEREYSKKNVYYNWLYRKITTIQSH